jgi:hypothetical protein
MKCLEMVPERNDTKGWVRRKRDSVLRFLKGNRFQTAVFNLPAIPL